MATSATDSANKTNTSPPIERSRLQAQPQIATQLATFTHSLPWAGIFLENNPLISLNSFRKQELHRPMGAYEETRAPLMRGLFFSARAFGQSEDQTL
ncbi:hypothetical protein G7048_22600 [Diaphorobacter sp. HDW4B]|uniref:hypothetical protein n=1 Tax=Diaphorobacter sp. HDW4B TaxID=2714925 RepID=UPI001407B44F|nr:hypothetical protein [Diaphorobacter sp. HDW4B]QIL72893.1 hypothetical protein G7048_22600 [Diaphorobacter sp. HDW4B]